MRASAAKAHTTENDARITGPRLLPVGLLTGLLSGILGVGGGILLIPLLGLTSPLTQHELHGTSLGVMAFTASAALVAYAAHGHVPWNLGLPLAVGGALGAPIGAWFAGRFHPRWLRGAFALFLFVVGVRMMVPLPPGVAGTGAGPGTGTSVGIGWGIGVLSGFLGVGGGVLLVPVLTLMLHVGQHAAQGASLAMVIPTALAGLPGYVRRHQVRAALIPWLAPASAATAFAGAAIAAWLPAARLQQIFGVLVAALAVRMAWSAARAPSSPE